MWFCVLEPLDQPSAFYADAVRLFNEPGRARSSSRPKTQRICTRRIPSLNLRETLFRMDGPNYGLWYVHVPTSLGRHALRLPRGRRVGSEQGRCGFNPYKLLLDPYGKGIDGRMELDRRPRSPTSATISEDGKVARLARSGR